MGRPKSTHPPVQLNVRVDRSLRETLNAYAQEREISLNLAVAWLLRRALAKCP